MLKIFYFLLIEKIVVLPCGLPYHNSEGHYHWGQALAARYPGMRQKYTLPTAICPTIHNRERPFWSRFIWASCLIVFFITSWLWRQRADQEWCG